MPTPRMRYLTDIAVGAKEVSEFRPAGKINYLHFVHRLDFVDYRIYGLASAVDTILTCKFHVTCPPQLIDWFNILTYLYHTDITMELRSINYLVTILEAPASRPHPHALWTGIAYFRSDR